MTVTVYSQPSCVQCTATYRTLDRQGTPYTVVNIADDPNALEHFKSLGHLSAPVVVAGDAIWSGFQPDKLKTLTRELAVSS